MVKAASGIGLNPDAGQPGTPVLLSGMGFSGEINIYFGTSTTPVATTTASYTNGPISVTFAVPSVSSGKYTVTARDSIGDSATYSFTVGSQASPTPTSRSSSSSSTSSSSSPSPITPYYTYPTLTPLTQSAGFWSTPTIAGVIVIVALAAIVSFILLQRNRGRREMLLERERPSYGSELPTQTSRPIEPPPYGQSPYSQSPYSRSPYSQSPYGQSRYSQPPSQRGQLSPYAQRYSRYGQPSAQPYAANRSTQPSSYGQLTSGKTCPHCKRTVRADYNICPYCNKRLR
jgi:hypothetical protein